MKKLAPLSLILFATVSAWGAGEARVSGKILTAEGAPIEGASVTITALEQRTLEKTVTSNEDGSYAIFVADGTIPYRVEVTKEGFTTFTDEWKLDLLPKRNEKDITLQATEQAPPAPGETNPAYEIFNEGVVLANNGETEPAIEKFKAAVELEPELAAGWKALARLYARTSQWEKAIEAGEKGIALEAGDDVLNSILADAYTMTGNKKKAAEYQRIAPANPAALFNQAVPYLNDNNDEKAEELLLKALEVDDGFAKAHYELGSLYARQSRNELSKKHLLRYLELEPEGENAVFAREMLKYLN